MRSSDVIVVGGGPAGSSCAKILREEGFEVMILDKTSFPRQKICAGWITPAVLKAANLSPKTYPFLLKQFDRLHFHIRSIHIPIKTKQYAIRRYEFDSWMLSSAAVPVEVHKVQEIKREGRSYDIDGKYSCRYLVGAGGTHCPVYKAFFRAARPRLPKGLISAVESEYQCDAPVDQCHLWFFDGKLPGYAWYVPKGEGWINIGVGGRQVKLKQGKMTIMGHWRRFIRKLEKLSYIRETPPRPRGHIYYLFQGARSFRVDNAFVIGDAAGLSTLDMGEGICTAVTSGMSAARAIAGHLENQPQTSSRFSLPGILKARF